MQAAGYLTRCRGQGILPPSTASGCGSAWLERCTGGAEVASSNLVIPTRTPVNQCRESPVETLCRLFQEGPERFKLCPFIGVLYRKMSFKHLGGIDVRGKKKALPSDRLHAAYGQAVVTFDGKDFYLGEHGTPQSHAR